jgi:Glycosyltransferase family 10 (fucosyltransferase) C-term
MTEKVIRAYQYETLPVLLGRGNYSATLPPGSYIDTKDFATPRLLASHLHDLTRDSKQYERYFQWKYDRTYLQLPQIIQSKNTDFCALCSLLNKKTLTKKRQTFRHLNKWFVKKEECKRGGSRGWGCRDT